MSHSRNCPVPLLVLLPAPAPAVLLLASEQGRLLPALEEAAFRPALAPAVFALVLVQGGLLPAPAAAALLLLGIGVFRAALQPMATAATATAIMATAGMAMAGMAMTAIAMATEGGDIPMASMSTAIATPLTAATTSTVPGGTGAL